MRGTRPMDSEFRKVCRCGAVFDAAGWRALPYVGEMHSLSEEEHTYELRNCRCGSTLVTEKC